MKRLVAALIILTAWTAASGQVARTQDGRALDANFQVGSGGYNSPVETWSPVNSQLFVTGQVTGLGSFRGQVPYFAPDQLRLDVPSATLGTFRQQSVGASQVLSGNPLVTSAYLERSSTVFGMPGITAGLAAPGSNVPMTSTLAAPVANRLFQEATEAYEPVLEMPPGRATSVEQVGFAPSLPVPPARPEGAVPANMPIIQTAAARMFGVSRPELAEELTRELQELAAQDERVDLRVEAEAEEQRPVGLVPQAEATEPPDEPRDLLEPADELRPGEDQKRPEPGSAIREAMPPVDEDVFTDLLLGMRQVREARQRAEESPEGAAPQEGAVDATARALEATREPQAETPAVEFAPTGIVLRSLAGRNQDRFNRTMVAAEKRLRAGRYYDAAERYQVATLLSPGNPLARVGLGLSLFAAGEPLSAAGEFRRALQLFPPLMEARVDLANLLPRELVEAQLERFELPEDETGVRDRPMAFVHTFMLRSIGDDEAARQAAERLAAAAGEDKLLAAYAQYVLTGKRPLEQSQTQPAKEED